MSFVFPDPPRDEDRAFAEHRRQGDEPVSPAEGPEKREGGCGGVLSTPPSPLISGKVELAQHECHVTDGQLMIFIPNAEGGSEPLTQETIATLRFLLELAEVALAQEASHGKPT